MNRRHLRQIAIGLFSLTAFYLAVIFGAHMIFGGTQ